MNVPPIADLPVSNLSCFEDHIRYGRLGTPQDTRIPFSDIDRVYYQRSVHPLAIASLLIAATMLMLAFVVFSSLWLQTLLTLFAVAIAVTGVRGFFADQVVFVTNTGKPIVRNCYDERMTVELFATNCSVAISIFKASDCSQQEIHTP